MPGKSVFRKHPQLRHWLVIVTVVFVLIITVFAWNSAAAATSGMEIVADPAAGWVESGNGVRVRQ